MIEYICILRYYLIKIIELENFEFVNFFCNSKKSNYLLTWGTFSILFQEKLFHFWFNTFFVQTPVTENGNREHKHCSQHEKSVHTNSMDESTKLRFPNNKMR